MVFSCPISSQRMDTMGTVLQNYPKTIQDPNWHLRWMSNEQWFQCAFSREAKEKPFRYSSVFHGFSLNSGKYPWNVYILYTLSLWRWNVYQIIPRNQWEPEPFSFHRGPPVRRDDVQQQRATELQHGWVGDFCSDSVVYRMTSYDIHI